ncbi:MAG: hypothetical protein NTX50_09340 [Candidatus Sumerlaeota bacterium]|nr:hypothetical protein [Candidatus Sumerlaeota bacterium]
MAAERHALSAIIGHAAAKAIAAFILLAAGVLWAWLAAGEIAPLPVIRKNRPRSDIYVFALLALLTLAVNWAPLHQDIPYLGDEGFHLGRAHGLRESLMRLIKFHHGLPALAGAILLAAYLACFRRIGLHLKVLILACGIAIAGTVLNTRAFESPKIVDLLTRYPAISCWFHQLGPVWDFSEFDEAMYRIVPLMAVFAIGWIVAAGLLESGAGAFTAIILALSAVLTPLLYYSTAFLYLEIPAVALLVIVFVRIESLIWDDFESVRNLPAWYALMAAGFIKEHLVATLFAFACARFAARFSVLIRGKRLSLLSAAQEFAAAYCVMAPIAIYLFFRVVFGNHPGNLMVWLNFLKPQDYLIYACAIARQAGALLPLAILGLAIEIARRRWRGLAAFALPTMATFAFPFVQQDCWLGLARWNLYAMAPLTVMALISLRWMAGKSHLALLAVGIACLALNIVLSPVAITGERNPQWALPSDPLNCEHCYEYKQAIRWLKQNADGVPVMLAGIEYGTSFDWYLKKAQYSIPTSSTQAGLAAIRVVESLQQELQAARLAGFPLVLHHRPTGDLELREEEKSIGGYNAVAVFRNHYLALVVYRNSKPQE